MAAENSLGEGRGMIGSMVPCDQLWLRSSPYGGAEQSQIGITKGLHDANGRRK